MIVACHHGRVTAKGKLGELLSPRYCFGLTKNNTITYNSTLDVGQKVVQYLGP
jgi:hypothetical protein